MLGIDIVEIERIEKLNKSSLEFIFTRDELEKSNKLKNKYQYLAGRFAAKEAFKKAYMIDAKFQDINIKNEDTGKPYYTYLNTKLDNLELSISHEKNYAIAVCLYKGE